MKTISRIILSLLIIICGSIGVYAQEEAVKKKVAVYVTGNDVESSVKKVVGAKLVSGITMSGEYAAVERTADFLAALSAESDYQTSGEVRDSQIARLGQKFGVRYVAVADVSELFDELFIASRLINVETGLVERSYDCNGPMESMPQLIALSQDVAAGLLKGIESVSRGKKQQNGGPGTINGHEYVDLGLPSGLKWATMNVGAYSPSDYGFYYAWGEIAPKLPYSESNSRTYNRSFGDIGGNDQYDAARANWGGSWRLPTATEIDELCNQCKWSFITMGDHNGYKVTGPNGNHIFIPAAGYRGGSSLNYAGSSGFYWSSTPYEGSQYAYGLYFYSGGTHKVDLRYRYYGRSVRPVSE